MPKGDIEIRVASTENYVCKTLTTYGYYHIHPNLQTQHFLQQEWEDPLTSSFINLYL